MGGKERISKIKDSPKVKTQAIPNSGKEKTTVAIVGKPGSKRFGTVGFGTLREADKRKQELTNAQVCFTFELLWFYQNYQSKNYLLMTKIVKT